MIERKFLRVRTDRTGKPQKVYRCSPLAKHSTQEHCGTDLCDLIDHFAIDDIKIKDIISTLAGSTRNRILTDSTAAARFDLRARQQLDMVRFQLHPGPDQTGARIVQSASVGTANK